MHVYVLKSSTQLVMKAVNQMGRNITQSTSLIFISEVKCGKVDPEPARKLRRTVLYEIDDSNQNSLSNQSVEFATRRTHLGNSTESILSVGEINQFSRDSMSGMSIHCIHYTHMILQIYLLCLYLLG